MISPLGKFSKGKICDLPSLDCVDFSHHFDTLGWTSFIQINTPLYPRLVQGFYACIKPTLEPLGVRGTLRGVAFELNVASLNDMLGAPNGGILLEPKLSLKNDAIFNFDECSRNICGDGPFIMRPKRHQLTLEAKILHKFIVANLAPRSGHQDEINSIDQLLMHLIIAKTTPINLGYLILKFILDVDKPNMIKALPFGFLLSYLFPLLGIPTLHEKKNDPTSSDILGSKTFKAMGYKFLNNEWVFTPKRGQRMQIDLESDDEEINLPASESEEEEEKEEMPHQAPPMPNFPQFNLEEAFTRLHTSVDNQFQTLRNDLNSQLTNLNNDINTMRSDMVHGFANVQEEMAQWRAYMDRFGPPPN